MAHIQDSVIHLQIKSKKNYKQQYSHLFNSQENACFVGQEDPKIICPHFKPLQTFEIVFGYTIKFDEQPCKNCTNIIDNQVCLECQQIYCSKKDKQDMQKHFLQNNDHCVALQINDCTFFCYKCQTYITNKTIEVLSEFFDLLKQTQKQYFSFYLQIEEKRKEELIYYQRIGFIENTLMEKSEVIQREFTYQDLISGLSDTLQEGKTNQVLSNEDQIQRQFKKIVFLTGAGISVSAGIPDFRTPETGLYSQLQKYNLPYPEAIFDINYFKRVPQPFYTFSKEFLTSEPQYTISHYLIAEINRRNKLLINFTQNIDGLEIDAGLPLEKLVQAHGHFRTAKCTYCLSKASINMFFECVKQEKILYCKICNIGIIKPDVVLFGENLPSQFFKSIKLIKQADLIFVMGTSLKVFPFANLIKDIKKEIPIVCINRENPEGDIDDSVEKILTDIKWNFPKIKRINPQVRFNLNKPKL